MFVKVFNFYIDSYLKVLAHLNSLNALYDVCMTPCMTSLETSDVRDTSQRADLLVAFPQSLWQTSILQKHIKNIHSSKGDKIWQCKICRKHLSGSGPLNLHLNSVHGNKNYKCESCGKSFSLADHLKKHIHTVHEGHKDYKCESCGKSFSTAGNLKQHIHAIHAGHKDQN